MGLTALDIVTLALVVWCAGLGIVRGFVTEVLSLMAWVFVVFALRLLTEPVSALLARPVGTDAGAAVLAYVLVGGVTYFGGRMIANAVGARTRTSILGPLDRALGFAFGAAKGLIFASLLFALAAMVLDTVSGGPGNRPKWITKSRTYPILNAVSARLSDMVARRRAGQAMLVPSPDITVERNLSGEDQ